ncbi:MAG: hypothetical protein HQM13_01830 [SAR324 cluster bacterium]|nr:hypothetical protein [SAR324 cluster bacterium]
MKYRIFFVSLLIWGIQASLLMAEPIVCSSLEMAKFLRGGFTDQEIGKFCILKSEPVESDLRKKYAKLEGFNWQTQYYLTADRKQKEEVFFTIGKDKVTLTSSNPKVQYYDVSDLGDTLRFKRRQLPYRAIYTITLKMDQMTESELPVEQQYKVTRTYIWTAK